MNHRPAIRTAAWAALAAAAAALPVGVALAHGDHPAGLTGAQRTVIREATRQFRNVDSAIAAGYLPTDTCVALPDGTAAMGYHYLHPDLAGDAKVDPTMPEILIYTKDASGRAHLAGVEYFVADDDQVVTTDQDRPTLMGHPFDGPMEGHEPGMPVHYDLHVWTYQHNPSGELAPWNPRVTCP